MTDVGTLTVLHAGAGDVELRADSPEELAKLLDCAEQMIKRGFAVLVQLPGGAYRRVAKIDRAAGEYVLGGRRAERRRIPGENPTRVPVREAKAASVGRSAGG